MVSAKTSTYLVLTGSALLAAVGIAGIYIGGLLADKPSSQYELINLVSDARLPSKLGNQAGSDLQQLYSLNELAKRPGGLEAAGYCLIAAAVAALVAAVHGVLAAKRYSKVAAALMAVLLVGVITTQVTALQLGNNFRARVEANTDGGWLQLQDQLFVPLDSPAADQFTEGAITAAINFVHVKNECCGAVASRDIASGRWLAELKKMNSTRQLPISCCPVNETFRENLKVEGPWDQLAKNLLNSDCPNHKQNAHDKPCVNLVKETAGISSRMFILVVAVAASCAVELVAFAAALIYCFFGEKPL